MKVALCLHGLAGGKNYKHGGLPVTNSTEAELWCRNFIQLNDADVFFHTWSVDEVTNLRRLYKPKLFAAGPRPKLVRPSTGDWLLFLKRLINHEPQELYRRNNIACRWRSFRLAVALMAQFAQDNRFEYDLVMVSRFDLSLTAPLSVAGLDPSKIYIPDWKVLFDGNGHRIRDSELISKEPVSSAPKGFPFGSEGVSDLWFLASQKDIQELANVDTDIRRYVDLNSNHLIALKKLEEMGALARMKKHLEWYRDFSLTRWRKSGELPLQDA